MPYCKEVTVTTCMKPLVVALLLVSACTVTPNPDARRALPDYAVVVGTQQWAVTCGNASVTGDWNQSSGFYAEDGSLKDHDRFCDDMKAGSNIRRGR
jgi:hypothetical protein